MANGNTETATLGGGCFWCLEPLFDEMTGVKDVVSGYAGGHVADPSYEDVCAGKTGHAEVVQVTFDPDEVSFREILGVFFTMHDPTTLNRQGADVGPQYRSIVLYHSDAQREATEAVIRELREEGVWPDLIVTEVEPFTAFYPAEEYHQEYYRKNPRAGYCRVVIAPKVVKFRERFKEKLRA